MRGKGPPPSLPLPPMNDVLCTRKTARRCYENRSEGKRGGYSFCCFMSEIPCEKSVWKKKIGGKNRVNIEALSGATATLMTIYGARQLLLDEEEVRRGKKMKNGMTGGEGTFWFAGREGDDGLGEAEGRKNTSLRRFRLFSCSNRSNVYQENGFFLLHKRTVWVNGMKKAILSTYKISTLLPPSGVNLLPPSYFLAGAQCQPGWQENGAGRRRCFLVICESSSSSSSLTPFFLLSLLRLLPTSHKFLQ